MNKFMFMFACIFIYIFMNKFYKIFKYNYYMMMVMFISGFLVINSLNVENYRYYFNQLFGMDHLTLLLILLTFYIFGLIFLSESSKEILDWLVWMFLLFLFLFISFVLNMMMYFYLFFEMSLIPMFMLILGWGSSKGRMSSGFFMLLYTLIGSLPLLMFLSKVYNYNKTSDFFHLSYNLVGVSYDSFFMYLMLMMGFFIKMPMFMFHIWLPKAHVEASVHGSMILAGILLKLGSYGSLRGMMYFYFLCMKFNIYFLILSVIGMIIVSLLCLREIDLKVIIAYSSVVHMGMLMAGMMTYGKVMYEGSLFMMISHGLISSGLFFVINMIYNRCNSRVIYLNKGLLIFMPFLSLWMFLMCSSNFGVPPSLNMLSEIILLMSLINWSSYLIIYLMFSLFLSACYSLYIYCVSQHGKFNLFKNFFNVGELKEFMILMIHWLSANLMFFCLSYFI